MTDIRFLKKHIPTLTFTELLNDIFNVKLTKLSRKLRSFGLKNILQKLVDDESVYGMIIVDDIDDVVQYFRESLDDLMDIPPELMRYFDIVQFIIDVIKSKDFDVYKVELGEDSVYVIIMNSDLVYDEINILRSLEELEDMYDDTYEPPVHL